MQKIFNTGETNEELRNMYNPEGSNLRAAQLRLLDMLDYLMEVCREIDVPCRLDGGNVMGAIRHGGFIPWDDDVDVVIHHSDRKRLCRYLMEHPHPQYVLQSPETDRGYLRPWPCLCDTHSDCTASDGESEKDKVASRRMDFRGLHIDIFPYEGYMIPSLHRLSSKIACFYNVDAGSRNPRVARLLFNIAEHGVFPLFRVFSRLFGQRNSYMHTFGTWFQCQFPEEVLRPHRDITFEGRTYPGPAQPERFCELLYKDWQNLPSREKRHVHFDEIKMW